jgi:hypothetical protein
MQNYITLDSIRIRIADSFVKVNKIGRGNGEARLYVGGYHIKIGIAFSVIMNCPASS